MTQIGDIVQSTAKELPRPRLFFGEIDPGYLLSGLVKKGEKDTVDVAWLPVELDHTHVNIVRKRRTQR